MIKCHLSKDLKEEGRPPHKGLEIEPSSEGTAKARALRWNVPRREEGRLSGRIV